MATVTERCSLGVPVGRQWGNTKSRLPVCWPKQKIQVLEFYSSRNLVCQLFRADFFVNRRQRFGVHLIPLLKRRISFISGLGEFSSPNVPPRSG
jgi:hypothetical protein